MHWRKDLTIETDFFEDGVEGIPDALLINSNNVETYLKTGLSDEGDSYAKTSAQIFDRVLSNRLAENFVECWQTLKQATLPPMTYMSHHRTSNSSLLSNVRAVEREPFHPLLHHRQDMIVINDPMASSNVEWLQTQQWRTHISTRLAEHHIQRAKLLKEIVDKLKKGKLQSQKTDEKIQKISENQYLLNHIKNLEKVTQQIQYQRMIERTHSHGDQYSQRQQYDYRREELREESDAVLEQQMWKELTLLKEELDNLKLDNQMILTQQNHRELQLKQLKMTKDQLQRTNDSLRMQKQQKNQPSPPNYIPNLNNNKTDEFKQVYEREMMLLNQRLKNMEEREQLTRQQFLRELALREELAKQAHNKQKAMMHQFIEAQRHRELIFQEQADKQSKLKLSLEKEQQIKESFLKQHALKEQQLRNQIKKQQQLREQAIRTCNQKQIDFRSSNLQHYSLIQQQLRQQIIQEYQQREENIRKQAKQLDQMSRALAQDRIKQKQQAVLEQNRIEEILKKATSPRNNSFHITPEMEMRLSPDKLKEKKELEMQNSPDKLRMNIQPKGHRKYESQELEIFEQRSLSFRPEKSYNSEEIQTDKQEDTITLGHKLIEPEYHNQNIYNMANLQSHLRTHLPPQQSRQTEPVNSYPNMRQQMSEPYHQQVVRIPPPQSKFIQNEFNQGQKIKSRLLTEREMHDMKATQKTVNINFRHDSNNSTFVSPTKTTSALITERTQLISPLENSQRSTIYNQSYGYGYGYATTHITKQTGAPPSIFWHHNSKDADSQTELQLTARPQQLPLYGSNFQARQLQWPKRNRGDNNDDCCNFQCC